MLVSEVYYDLVKEVAAQAKVLKLEGKGNLRHRIIKLGTEKDEALLSVDQKALRDIAKAQHNSLEPLDGELLAPKPRHERPWWATGALVYCAKEHVAEVRQALTEQGVHLQSKHIIVSEVHEALLRRVLTHSPEGPGREAFLLRRAGAIEQVESVNLPCVHLSRNHRSDVPHGNLIMDKCNRNTYLSEQLKSPMMYGSLEPLAATWENIHDDLFDFLTAPPSVQSMYEHAEDMWQEVWSIVCQENGELEMLSRKDEARPSEEEMPAGFQHPEALGAEAEAEDDEESADCYVYCKVCSRKANVSHLVSADCPVRNGAGPLLKAILAAEQTRLKAEEEAKATGARQLQQEQQQQLQMQQQQQSVAEASHDYSDAKWQLAVQSTSSLAYSQQPVGEQQHWYPPVYKDPALLWSRPMYHWSS